MHVEFKDYSTSAPMFPYKSGQIERKISSTTISVQCTIIMSCHVIFTGAFLTLFIYLLLTLQESNGTEATANSYPAVAHKPMRNRILTRFARPANQYGKFKPEMFNEFLVDDDDFFELPKRQTSDDYGHMRFGKRGDEQFDDYGHMRFGRSGTEK